MRACLALGLLMTLAAWGAEAPLRVFVSIEPQAYLAKRIAGGHAEVEVFVPAGQSPETYEPSPRRLADLSRARAWFTIGMPFEKTLGPRVRRAFPDVEMMDSRKGIALLQMPEHGHEHHEGEPDPHVWLDPLRGKAIARNMAEALRRLDPAHAEEYGRNLAALEKELDAVDARLRESLKGDSGRRFYVFHPAFGYFAERYGLVQVPVEMGGKTPTAKRLAALVKAAHRDGVRVLFTQPQYSPDAVETLARAIGAKVETLSDLPSDYVANFEDMANKLRAALAVEGGE